MPTYQQTVLADSPVGYWRFQEASGATCADSSTSGFTGTAAGTFTRNVSEAAAGWTPGITLGGTTSDFVSVPDNNALDITGAITVELVVTPARINQQQALVSKGHSNVSPGGFVVAISATNHVQLFNGFDGTVIITGAFTFAIGTTYHVVVQRDGSNNPWVWLNGALDTQGAVNAAPFGATNEPLVIGANSANGTKQLPYQGTVDEVAVYSSFLSSSRIAAHYAARNTGSSSSPGRSASPGQLVAAAAHDRNLDRRDDRSSSSSSRRSRLDAYRLRR